MKIETPLVEMGTVTENANRVKATVLQKLWKDGVITEEEFDKYCAEYQVIMVKDSWFEQWINKFKDGDSSGYIYKYVNFND